MQVYAKCHLQQGVMFGPFVGEVSRGQMPANLKYAWAVSRLVCVDIKKKFKSSYCKNSVVLCYNYI